MLDENQHVEIQRLYQVYKHGFRVWDTLTKYIINYVNNYFNLMLCCKQKIKLLFLCCKKVSHIKGIYKKRWERTATLNNSALLKNIHSLNHVMSPFVEIKFRSMAHLKAENAPKGVCLPECQWKLWLLLFEPYKLRQI